MTRSRRAARDFIRLARDRGHEPTLKGDWVKWEPALPGNLLFCAVEMANEIAAALAQEIGSVPKS